MAHQTETAEQSMPGPSQPKLATTVEYGQPRSRTVPKTMNAQLPTITMLMANVTIQGQ